jgi:hypothetical protein
MEIHFHNVARRVVDTSSTRHLTNNKVHTPTYPSRDYNDTGGYKRGSLRNFYSPTQQNYRISYRGTEPRYESTIGYYTPPNRGYYKNGNETNNSVTNRGQSPQQRLSSQ